VTQSVRARLAPALLRGELLDARAVDDQRRAERRAVEACAEPAATVPPWWLSAACRGKPTDWWYPERGDRFTGTVATMICAGCLVRDECLEAALDEERLCGPPYGIRGGRSARARTRMLRRRHAATVAANAPAVATLAASSSEVCTSA
jgi:hypothetical protein